MKNVSPGLPWWSVGRNTPANAGMLEFNSGQEDSTCHEAASPATTAEDSSRCNW